MSLLKRVQHDTDRPEGPAIATIYRTPTASPSQALGGSVNRMLQRDSSQTTAQKALTVNLNPHIYGTIVEIGAGQEVARQFFKAGAAAGTVAKTMSAYDMRVSDEIYGQTGRYVSRERVERMMDREFGLVVERLSETRPRDTTFFAYAATVTAKGYKTSHDTHGWIGIKLQLRPKEAPCEVTLHVRMLDNSNELQADALGILGVNLIHGVFTYQQHPEWIVDCLNDNLGSDRIEIDLIHFAGPAFNHVDNRLMNLQLIQSWLTRAVMFNPQGESVVPSEELYKKSPLVVRGSCKPPAKSHTDMAAVGLADHLKHTGLAAEKTLTMAEISVSTLMRDHDVDNDDFLARVDLTTALGYHVLLSDFVRTFSLRSWLTRCTKLPVTVTAKSSDFSYLFNDEIYEGIEGGLLEALGRLLTEDTRLLVYPSQDADGQKITLKNVDVPPQHRGLLDYLIARGKIKDCEEYDASCYHTSARAALRGLTSGSSDWETEVPEIVRDIIVERSLFGFRRKN